MTWTAYTISPIDFLWELLPTVEDVAALLAKGEAADLVSGRDRSWFNFGEFRSDFQQAQLLAQKKGWEGAYQEGSEPRVFWLPDEDSFSYAFVWKQRNNGDTFVISPRPLGWLNDNT